MFWSNGGFGRPEPPERTVGTVVCLLIRSSLCRFLFENLSTALVCMHLGQLVVNDASSLLRRQRFSTNQLEFGVA